MHCKQGAQMEVILSNINLAGKCLNLERYGWDKCTKIPNIRVTYCVSHVSGINMSCLYGTVIAYMPKNMQLIITQ